MADPQVKTHGDTAAAVACPVEALMREWAQLRRGECPIGFETDEMYGARCDAGELPSTSDVGALFQLLCGMMAADMDGHPWGHEALLHAYVTLRGRLKARDPDLEFVERYFFTGAGMCADEMFPVKSASAQDWLRMYARRRRVS